MAPTTRIGTLLLVAALGSTAWIGYRLIDSGPTPNLAEPIEPVESEARAVELVRSPSPPTAHARRQSADSPVPNAPTRTEIVSAKLAMGTNRGHATPAGEQTNPAVAPARRPNADRADHILADALRIPIHQRDQWHDWLATKRRAERDALAGVEHHGPRARAAAFCRVSDQVRSDLVQLFGKSRAMEISRRVPLHTMESTTGAMIRIDATGRPVPEPTDPPWDR